MTTGESKGTILVTGGGGSFCAACSGPFCLTVGNGSVCARGTAGAGETSDLGEEAGAGAEF